MTVGHMIQLPDSYYLAVATFLILTIYGALRWKAAWSVPYIAVLFTVAAWYFVEPYYFPDFFYYLNSASVQACYDSVLIFYLAFALLAPISARWMGPTRSMGQVGEIFLPAHKVFITVAILWAALLSYGILRTNGDVLAALFPLDARRGVTMWQRSAGAGAGNTGFIVSTAGYLYNLCLAAFGLLYFLLPSGRWRLLALVLIVTSWPYAFLQGSRNVVLATVSPGIASYVLFSRQSFVTKVIVLIAMLAGLDFALKVIIHYRNIGFGDVNLTDLGEVQHEGLNMASELVYINEFLSNGTLQTDLGAGYLTEVANVVARFIWPDKPLIGIDYAIARGFSGGDSDIGVTATISTGLIGQGVLAFGAFLGPIWAAFLMSLYVGAIARFRAQRTPLRLALFLVGLGLTFSLGRDISLLVLWPLVFGYAGVRLVEWRTARTHTRARLAINSRVIPPRHQSEPMVAPKH